MAYWASRTGQTSEITRPAVTEYSRLDIQSPAGDSLLVRLTQALYDIRGFVSAENGSMLLGPCRAKHQRLYNYIVNVDRSLSRC
jgi:hypothetical protein